MFSFLISSSVFILLVILLRHIFHKHISMRIQYMLWLLVAVKLLIFPVPWVESAISIFNIPDKIGTAFVPEGEEAIDMDDLAQTGMEEADVSNVTSPSLVTKDSEISSNNIIPEGQQETEKGRTVWTSALFLLAFIGTVVCFCCWISTNWRFSKYLKEHRIKQDKYDVELPVEIRLPVYVAWNLPSPCFYRRAIYVTPDCMGNSVKLRHILVHEYSHYKQGDGVWSLLRGICLCIYWWHPLVWAAVYLSKQDCELSCDEAALKYLGDGERLSYGETLLGLIGGKPGPRDFFSVATTMVSGKRSLKQRILAISKKAHVVIPVCILVIAAVLMGLAATSTSKSQQAADIEDEKIIDVAGENELTDEELQEWSKEELWEGYAEWKLSVYHISWIEKKVDDWEFYEYGDDTSAVYAQYNRSKRAGGISGDAIGISESCRFYVSDQVGRLVAKEVSYDEFMGYFPDIEQSVGEDHTNAAECQCQIRNGSIIRIELGNPYLSIANISYISEGHDYYNQYGLADYTLQKTYQAHINRDRDAEQNEQEEADTIEVYTGDAGDGESGMVLVYSGYPVDDPYSIEAHTSRAGWKSIYLVSIGEKDYIFQMNMEIRDTFGQLTYVVYSFGCQAGPNLATIVEEGAIFEWNENINYDSFEQWAERADYYLKDATLLLSTQDGMIRTGPDNDYERYNSRKLLEEMNPVW